MEYLCKYCCGVLGIEFNGLSLNPMGVKYCRECGNSDVSELHAVGDDVVPSIPKTGTNTNVFSIGTGKPYRHNR